MKIAVFENEYDSVKIAFEAANELNFDSKLDIDVFAKTQLCDLNKISQYSVIFIDIDLATASNMDGYSLLNYWKDNDNVLRKVIILTGNNKIKEGLEAKKIDPNILELIIKPTNYSEVTQKIKTVLLKNSKSK
ncbi:response regulator [Sphingobacterium sp. BIGb0116]|uniref:response regulator n=1 Tax=Sphingobacterium sp. BIGb0116 TaxID=2940619 RepID=UPI002169455D|nr:response regulator [Sphingobacterium sp. BIGb0116]MCS4163788.1 CheY-like chemotaxis protein [Sphingobacterium sp. BIGb0116]